MERSRRLASASNRGVGAVLIRPTMRDDDLDAVHEGDDQWMGSPMYWQLTDAYGADNPVGAWCVDEGGRTVGHAFANYRTSRVANMFLGYAWTVPDERRRGIGTALFDAIKAQGRELGFDHCISWVPDSNPDSVAVAQAWGGVEDGYHFESQLDLATLSDEAVASLTSRAAAVGVALRWLETDDELRALVPFVDAVYRDAPDSGQEAEPLTFEILRAMTEPAHVLVAEHDGEPVGITYTFDRPDIEGAVNTGFTGVERAWRGHGLASALKASAAATMRDRGRRVMVTQNMRGNDHILAANDRLGFVRGPGWYDYVFEL